jgi:hypothetical protein
MKSKMYRVQLCNGEINCICVSCYLYVYVRFKKAEDESLGQKRWEGGDGSCSFVDFMGRLD